MRGVWVIPDEIVVFLTLDCEREVPVRSLWSVSRAGSFEGVVTYQASPLYGQAVLRSLLSTDPQFLMLVAGM